MRIYLAGKVAKHDWRHDIVGDGLRGADGNMSWRNQEIELPGGHIYVGPFFVSCDHGCSHFVGEHGITKEMCFGDRGFQQEYEGHAPSARANRAPGPDIASGELATYNERRRYVFGQCCGAIERADLVFAWLDDPTAFGTIWELGYARGTRVQTAIGVPHGLDLSDLWFAIYGAGQVYRTATPREALERSVGSVDDKALFMRCESPIETALLAALLAESPRRRGCRIVPQFDTLGYRLDFALFGPSGNVAIECDGHDFHERTKEQARHDRRRDRKLTAASWLVARFTGSEIHKDAAACAREAMRMALGTEAAE